MARNLFNSLDGHCIVSLCPTNKAVTELNWDELRWHKGRQHTDTHRHTHLSLTAAGANYKLSQTSNPSPPSQALVCFCTVNDIIVWRRCWAFPAPLNATAPASSNTADGRWKNESGNHLYYGAAIRNWAGCFCIPVQTRRGRRCLTTGNGKWFFLYTWDSSLLLSQHVEKWFCIHGLFGDIVVAEP